MNRSLLVIAAKIGKLDYDDISYVSKIMLDMKPLTNYQRREILKKLMLHVGEQSNHVFIERYIYTLAILPLAVSFKNLCLSYPWTLFWVFLIFNFSSGDLEERNRQERNHGGQLKEGNLEEYHEHQEEQLLEVRIEEVNDEQGKFQEENLEERHLKEENVDEMKLQKGNLKGGSLKEGNDKEKLEEQKLQQGDLQPTSKKNTVVRPTAGKQI